ncbi:MAG: DUF2934 domain-containing protein [Methylotenera sp.]|uniref:DUF2934 domain-containing protein n=1 Tax=Methylotenera sp. TaxID=2051956 RepID=UPI00248941CA|nr:DUF2934 domain-containing protein [Methylotenera sp.]MDI1309863.1 DUF2934 domain-containing protein [Methylotenera sp.]
MDLHQDSTFNKSERSNHGNAPIEDFNCEPGVWFYTAEKQRLIEVTAYLLAEQDGFVGNPQDYWRIAEVEVGGLKP